MKRRVIIILKQGYDGSYLITVDGKMPKGRNCGSLKPLLRVADQFAAPNPSVVLVVDIAGTITRAIEYLAPEDLMEDGIYARNHVKAGVKTHIPVEADPELFTL